MSEAAERRTGEARARRLPARIQVCALVFGGTMLVGSAPPAGAALASHPTVPGGFSITKVAGVPRGVTNCDDLARLDGHLFVGCQNATLSTGGGGNSTVLEYSDDGALLNTWSIADKVDGLGADPPNHRLIATLNEDAHSHLATITPSAPTGQQIVPYDYSPGPPGSTAATGALHTGGGTDSVVVDAAGHVYVTASHPQGHTGTAVLRVALTPPAQPGGAGTAALSSTWLDDATATNGAPPGGSVKLALGDVDSGAIVPYTSPRFGGSFVIDDQTSQQLVFATPIDAGTQATLTEIRTPFGLDDIRWATTDGGTLFVVDKGAPAAAGVSSLWKVTGPFVAGTAIAANDGLGDQVVTVNLATGALTPLVRHLVTTKGLVYVDATGTDAPLTLAGVPGRVAGAPAASRGSAGGGTSKDSDALPTVLAIVALVLALAAGAAHARSRRPPRPA